jgi:phage terminase large subunit-like protein
MPWQTPEYYKAQRQELRPLAYLRLHENRWVSSESSLIDTDLWDVCIDRNYIVPPPPLDLYLGIDASTKRDRSAVVSVHWGEDKRLYLGPKRFWQPSKSDPLDLERTVEAYILELEEKHNIELVNYDPYQFHRSGMTLRDKGIPMQEFNQTVDRLTKMTNDLLDMLTQKQLVLYPDNAMRKEARQAVGKETARGLRITKEKTSHKIDQIVALAMAVQAAIEEAPEDYFPVRIIDIYPPGTGPDGTGFWIPIR